ncbi:hypothetical protein BKA70DRAFT_1445947 [Coprinopsis sp. MPI-PUGE-AT-0042]|nr:hypothetical protein BKA70DRAFT_1445947 [Coprinopsis sp. MPI-PUGE-AT-0042]
MLDRSSPGAWEAPSDFSLDASPAPAMRDDKGLRITSDLLGSDIRIGGTFDRFDEGAANAQDENEVESILSGEPLASHAEMNPQAGLLATIKRQKHQLQLRNNSFWRMEGEQKLLKERLAELEEELEEKDCTIETLRENKLQYRNWWLNEIRFTQYLLNKEPELNRDVNLVRTTPPWMGGWSAYMEGRVRIFKRLIKFARLIESRRCPTTDLCATYSGQIQMDLSPRGAGFLFGAGITRILAHNNAVGHIARAHQLAMEEYKLIFNRTIAMVWSVPNYRYRRILFFLVPRFPLLSDI